MIIDLETHIRTQPVFPSPGSPDGSDQINAESRFRDETSPAEFDQAMECVDVSVILGFTSRYLNISISNERIAYFVGQAPNRRVGIAGIDPMAPDAIDSIQQAADLGLIGVTISPAMQNFHPNHSQALRVYERCEKLALPLLIRYGIRYPQQAVMEYANPIFLDEVARNFPSLRIVFGSIGYPFIEQTLTLVGKHPNVYADLAGIASHPWRLYNVLLSAYESGVMDKILFASNFPFDTPEKTIERIYSLNRYSHGTNLPAIPRQQLRNIVERDTFCALGLERPGGAPISSGIGSGLEPIEEDEPKSVDIHVSTLSELISGKPKDTDSG